MPSDIGQVPLRLEVQLLAIADTVIRITAIKRILFILLL